MLNGKITSLPTIRLARKNFTLIDRTRVHHTITQIQIQEATRSSLPTMRRVGLKFITTTRIQIQQAQVPYKP